MKPGDKIYEVVYDPELIKKGYDTPVKYELKFEVGANGEVIEINE